MAKIKFFIVLMAMCMLVACNNQNSNTQNTNVENSDEQTGTSQSEDKYQFLTGTYVLDEEKCEGVDCGGDCGKLTLTITAENGIYGYHLITSKQEITGVAEIIDEDNTVTVHLPDVKYLEDASGANFDYDPEDHTLGMRNDGSSMNYNLIFPEVKCRYVFLKK